MLQTMLKLLKYGRLLSAQSRTHFQNDSIKLSPPCGVLVRQFHNSFIRYQSQNDDSNSKDSDAANVRPTIASKYERFTDDKATIILDIEEERDKMLAGEMETEIEVEDTTSSMFQGLSTARGKTGVFDIDDLVAVLKRDNAENIFVCTVPKQLKYVDYLCVITARSPRHMKAIAEFVRKMFKLKRDKGDILPKIEGKNSDEWMAMDLGNIALHIFSAKIRKQYDLEMLWSVGPDYDTETNKPNDPILDLFDQHTVIFDSSLAGNSLDGVRSSAKNTVDLDNELHQSNDVKITDVETK